MTERGRRRRLTPRQRKLWVAGAATIAGVAALATLVWGIDRARDTDRADARTNITARFAHSAAAGESPLRFTNVAAASGIVGRHGVPARHRALPEDNGSGLAWGDYDGDGDWDLYLVNHPGIRAHGVRSTGTNRLYRNNGDGTFSDVTDAAGVGDPTGFGMGATFVDYDDDGDVDLYVTNRGPNRLFQNQGNGTFIDVAVHAGVDDPLWGTGTAWGDFDRDGHIDFYLCNYVTYDSEGFEPPATPPGAGATAAPYEAPFTLNPNSYNAQPNRLYRNRGDGTFADVTACCDVANPDGRSLAATFVDLDGDGWLDLYVNNDVSPNRLYRNSGADFGPDEPIVFVDLSALSGTADPRGSMGLSVAELGDLAGAADGLPDLFITHWVAQENALYLSQVGTAGKLEYRDKTRQFGLGEISLDRVGWGCAFADLDRDGHVDIAVANGSTLEQHDNPLLLKPEPLFLFLNTGSTFREVAPAAGADTSRTYTARGLAAADYDGDGDVDLALSCNQDVPVLLRNDTETMNRSLSLRLHGRAAVCFGAKIEVTTGARREVRWWGADVSYLSMHAPEMIFGLGPAAHATQIRVTWADGAVSELTHVAAAVVTVSHADAVAPAEP